MNEILVFLMFPALCLMLITGYPVAFCLVGTGLLFGAIGSLLGVFDLNFFSFLPDRIFGIVNNEILIAIPLFVFMGIMLERSRIAEELLKTLGAVFAPFPSGMAIGVTIVGTLLAASTGVVGATVVAMGLLSLPTMLSRGYSASFACGSICASGTLGQIIPPSILLILLADQTSNAYRVGQMSVGNMAPEAVSVLDLFAGALVPGFMLVAGYIILQLLYGVFKPDHAPATRLADAGLEHSSLLIQVIKSLVPPLFLILAVLGSILGGIATPTEAASVGAIGAALLAVAHRRLNLAMLRDVMRETLSLTAMIFMILIGATTFTLVFRGLGGDDLVHELLTNIAGGELTVLLIVMITVFILGFFIDFIEIIVIVVPIVGPALFAMDINPIWFAILLAINLQTSFLTPPFGFSLFYLQGVVPEGVRITDIYKGVIPFIGVQLAVLLALAAFPELVTWLPELINGGEMFQGGPQF